MRHNLVKCERILEQMKEGSPVRRGNGAAQLKGTREGLPEDMKNKQYGHERNFLTIWKRLALVVVIANWS